METQTGSEQADGDKGNEVDNAFENPVLRTYMRGCHIDGKCLALALGVVMIVVGPLTGMVLRNQTEHAIWKRQRIDDSTPCFAEQVEDQRCANPLTVDITFFNVDNQDAVATGDGRPVLSEVGPYTFIATEVHESVSYEDDSRLSFVERQLSLERGCEMCDWSVEMTILRNNGLETATAEELAQQLLQKQAADVVLNTGASKIEEVYDVVQYRDNLLTAGIRYNGKLFGDAFSSKAEAMIFDSVLETSVALSPTGTKIDVRGIDAAQLVLSVHPECPSVEAACADTTWETENANVVYSLPYVHYANGSSFASEESRYKAEDHSWEIFVDSRFGFTLTKSTTYQVNQWIDGFGSDAYWTASAWIRIRSSATDNDVDFIKDTVRRKKLIFYLCDLAVTLSGAVIVALTSALLFCTPAARERLSTMRMLARSRARDARLNPLQFKALGKFLRGQMRRKRTTQSTDSAKGGPLKSQTTTQSKSKDFDDLGSIPTTTEQTV